ncbi:hypothetical protein ACT89R_30195 (plasmid) [Rhodococcus qingshengii]
MGTTIPATESTSGRPESDTCPVEGETHTRRASAARSAHVMPQ